MVGGDLVREVDALKQGAQGDIAVFGGSGFASALVAADLVDEYAFFINPAAIGSGHRLFAQSGFRALTLLGSKAYGCGIVVNRYARQSKQ